MAEKKALDRVGTVLENPDIRIADDVIASIAALVFNAIFDPIVGYYYKLWILGRPAADLTLSWSYASTTINSVVSIVVSTALYMALRPALQKAHLLPKVN